MENIKSIKYLKNKEAIILQNEIQDIQEFSTLEGLTWSALFHPINENRQKSIQILAKRYSNSLSKITGGFVLSEEVFLTLKYKTGAIAAGYIGKMPKNYCREPTKVHNFIV